MMPTFSLLAAPEVVITTASHATDDDTIVIMTITGFQYQHLSDKT